MSAPSPRSFLVTETIDLLLYISKTQSFTETSRLMGLSQSMVSRKLSAFEAATGITAVDRSSRPVKLTPEGKMLLEALMPYIEGLPVVLDKLQTDSNIKRKLRIGFVDTFTRYIACHVIKDVSSDVTQCTALSGTSDHLLHCFKRDELDVFITSDPSLGLEDVRRQFFYGEPSLLAYPASVQFPESNIDWSHLRFCGLPCIGLTTGSGGGKLFDNFLLTHNIPIHQRINVDSTAVLLELINEGIGWAITRPAGIIQHWETIPNVKLAPIPKPLLSRELYLVSKKSFPFDLFRLIVESLVRITREQLAKKTIEFAPWLKEDIYTIDLDNDKKIPFSAFLKHEEIIR